MIIEYKIRDEKVQYDINREATKMSGKVDKYEYFTGKKIFASDRTRVAPYQYLDYLIDSSFQGVNRLIVLSFGNDAFRTAHTRP